MGLLERNEVSSRELWDAYRAAIDERDGELHCLPLAHRRARRRRRADRAQGRDRHEGGRDDRGLEDPEGLRPRLRLDGRRAGEGRGPAAARQDQHRRVRDGLVDRELGVRAVAQPVGPDPRPRRLRAAARRPRSRAAWRPGRSAPTPAARSSSRPRSAGSSGCGRPTAPSRATASSRSPPASTRSARRRRPSATARCSTA